MALSNYKKRIIVVVLIAAAALYFGGRNFIDKCYYPPILMYHSVDDNGAKLKLSVSTHEFRWQMKYLRDKKFHIVSLEQLSDILKSGKVPHNIAAVTLDDGNLDNYTNAFSTLKEYKIPATIFVVSSYIGKPDYLDAAQIKEMSDAGIDIESHSVTHPHMDGLAKDELISQIYVSKKAIEGITGKTVYTFCFPFGGYNEDARQILKDGGFKAAFVTMPRDNSIKLDPYRMKRIKIAPGPFDHLDFRIKTSGYYTWFKAHRWTKKKQTDY